MYTIDDSLITDNGYPIFDEAADYVEYDDSE